MISRAILLITMSFFLTYSVVGQQFHYSNYVYVTNIKSVQLMPVGQPLELPVVSLENGGSLKLSFDDLTDEYRDYSYKVIHCTRDWKPTDMSEIEYITGFQNEEIRNYHPSQSTFIPYINYQLTLPNKDIRWTKSGNYLLVVYEGDKDDRFPVITRRFVVTEDKVKIIATPKRPVAINQYDTHHIFDIDLNKNKSHITNAQRDITATILQNGRWDTAMENIHSLYVTGDKIIIENRGKIAFRAGREYRSLDIRSLNYASDGIDKVLLNSTGTDVVKLTDLPRKSKGYLFHRDANGSFVIQNKDGGNNHAAGDYAKVHFALKYPDGYDVYVAGAFSDYQADDLYKMSYNDKAEQYEASILLKQGYYDYIYAVRKDGGLDYSEIEGDSFDTNNYYNVIIYYREPGSRYDRAIAYTVFDYSLTR